MTRASHTETVRGELVAFTVKGADYWGIGTVRTRHDGGEVKVTGKLLGASPGDSVELEGFTEETKWGPSFKVRSCVVVLPADASGVVGWLASKLPQVSRRRAEELVARLGVEGVWAALEAGDVAALTVTDGITDKRAAEILAAYTAHKGSREKEVRLKGYGLTDNQIARAVAVWGDDADKMIRDNPYALAEHVDGFGWAKSDAIATRMGLPRNSEARCAAGVMHAMGEATQAGHCYVPQGKLIAITLKDVVKLADETPVRRALEALIDAGRLVRRETAIYLPKIAGAEVRLAEAMAARASSAQKGRAA